MFKILKMENGNAFDSIARRFMLKMSVMALAVMGVTQPAQADLIPYANPRTVNPANYDFTVAASGSMTLYFASKSAGDNDQLWVSVNNGSYVNTGINDQAGSAASFTLSSLTAGDQLEFKLENITTGLNFYSTSSMNPDGLNHVYSTAYTATSPISYELGHGPGSSSPVIVPAGTFVGFEDLPSPNSDFDYNDLTFIADNITVTAVPEPTTMVAGALMLLPLGAGILRILRNRKMA